MLFAQKVRETRVCIACAINGENPIGMIRWIARSVGDRTSTIIAIATNLPQSVRRLVFTARSDLKSNIARLDSAPPFLSLSLVDLPPFLLPLWSTSSTLSLFSPSSVLRTRDSSADFFGTLGKTLISLDWNGDTSNLYARFLRPYHDILYNRGFNVILAIVFWTSGICLVKNFVAAQEIITFSIINPRFLILDMSLLLKRTIRSKDV